MHWPRPVGTGSTASTESQALPVVLSASAVTDLQSIQAWIRRDSPVRPASSMARLLGACEELAVMPFAFGALDRYRSLEMRRRPVQDCLILYRVGPGRVEILRVPHGARDLAALLTDAIDA